MTPSYEELERMVKSQKRQQVALIVLSVVLAGSTIVTWKSVAAIRAANEMQKQMLESRKVISAPKAAVRRSNARQDTQASAESRRPPGSTQRGAQKRIGDRTAAIDSAIDVPVPTTRTPLDRPGRQ
jgi:hypothetical protein